MASFNYKPTATGMAFHNSGKFIKLLVGPYAGGKTTILAVDILINACAQKPAPDGVRYCRVGVIRSSYPELISSTRKSLLEVFPAECGTIVSTGSPMRGLYNIPLVDGTRVQLELALWAVQTEADTEKIKSANWTFGVINEATGCHPTVLTSMLARIGRFPPANLGGASWSGILMDTNQPVPGSWLDDFIQDPKDNWDIFIQPPAAFKKEGKDGSVIYEVNPDAENLYNLGSPEPDDPVDFTPAQRGMRFYKNQIESLVKIGRTDIIENQYCLLRTAIVDGKPVYPSFDRKRHVALSEIKPMPFNNIVLGMDQSGIHPAAVIMQQQKDKWCVLDELYMAGEGFEVFLVSGLIPLLRSKYSSNGIHCVIDPSNQKDSWQGVAPSDRLQEYGITAITNITNSPKARIQCVEHMLNLYSGGLSISPTCEMLVRGFESEYRYRRVRAAGSVGAVYTTVPEKNEYSHCHDALGYCCLFITQGLAEENNDYKKMTSAVNRHRQKLVRVV